jgi:hypothetical protein
MNVTPLDEPKDARVIAVKSNGKNTQNTAVFPPWYTLSMKIGVSLPEELIAFADEAAKRQGISRSVLLARLLEAERVHQQTQRYLDQHGWDVADDETAWRKYQRRRMAAEYRDDEW